MARCGVRQQQHAAAARCSSKQQALSTHHHDVAAAQDQGNGLVLHVRGQQPALLLCGAHELGEETEVFEAARHLV
jgi:hypothetical protein